MGVAPSVPGLALLLALATAGVAAPIGRANASRQEEPEAIVRREDVLVLADGRILEGLTIERLEDGVLVHFVHGDVRVPGDQVIDALIVDEVFEPVDDADRHELSKGHVRFDGQWMSVARRNDLVERRLAERRAQVEAQVAHSTWGNRKREASKWFEWEHVLPDHVFEHFSGLMDAYFDQFAKDWKIKKPRRAERLLVCFYKDRDEMVQVGGAPAGVLGYFRFVDPIELDFFYDRMDPEFTEEVMFHEANHYLQSLIDEDFDYPHFPGESLAEYYGSSKYDPETGKIESGLILEGRLVEVQADILADEWMGLERLVSTERLYEHYTWGWTLVHFLMSERKTARAFKEFMVGLAKAKGVQRVSAGRGGVRTCRGPEVWRYFKECLDLDDEDDVLELQARWHAYVREQLDFVSAAGKSRAAERAADEGRRLRAKRLHSEALAEAEATGEVPAILLHRAAQFHLGDDRPDEAAELWRRALAEAPLEAEFYAWLGSALRRSKKTEDEGLRMQLLALEIDPYNDKAALDIDLAELLGTDDPDKGQPRGLPGKDRRPGEKD